MRNLWGWVVLGVAVLAIAGAVGLFLSGQLRGSAPDVGGFIVKFHEAAAEWIDPEVIFRPRHPLIVPFPAMDRVPFDFSSAHSGILYAQPNGARKGLPALSTEWAGQSSTVQRMRFA